MGKVAGCGNMVPENIMGPRKKKSQKAIFIQNDTEISRKEESTKSRKNMKKEILINQSTMVNQY